MMAHREIFVQGETVYQGPRFSLRHDVVELEDGRRSGREVIQLPDRVMLVALSPQGGLLCRFQRPALDSESWELPQQTVEAGESPWQAACRLAQTLGLPQGEIKAVGCLRPSPAILQQAIHVFALRAQTAPGEGWVALPQLRQAMVSGAIGDLRTMAALGLARAAGWQEV